VVSRRDEERGAGAGTVESEPALRLLVVESARGNKLVTNVPLPSTTGELQTTVFKVALHR
jgi:hypothetical protein